MQSGGKDACIIALLNVEKGMHDVSFEYECLAKH